MNTYYYLASTYGSNAYNSSSYNGDVTGTSTGSNGGGSGVLTDTGIMLASVVTLACLIALVAVAVKIWKRPSQQLAAQPIETSESLEVPESHQE